MDWPKSLTTIASEHRIIVTLSSNSTLNIDKRTILTARSSRSMHNIQTRWRHLKRRSQSFVFGLKTKKKFSGKRSQLFAIVKNNKKFIRPRARPSATFTSNPQNQSLLSLPPFFRYTLCMTRLKNPCEQPALITTILDALSTIPGVGVWFSAIHMSLTYHRPPSRLPPHSHPMLTNPSAVSLRRTGTSY